MFNRGAYTTFGVVCKKKFPIWMVPAFIHTHAGTEYVKQAGVLYTPRVPLGAHARCEMYMPSCLE